MTSKQRAYLRSLANTLEPLLQVGKGGVSERLIAQLDLLLEHHELVKVRILKTADLDAYALCTELAEATHAEPVQTIGNKLVLYRESVDHKEIYLPY